MTEGKVTMKRLVLLAAVLAIVAPVNVLAAPATYSAPYLAGPEGGDQYNQKSRNLATGEMTVLRINPAGISGGLGCGGTGGFSNFLVKHDAAEPVKTVTVAYTDAIIDPYTWITVSVRQGEGFLGTQVERGIIAGDGTVTLTLRSPASGPLDIWFGIQVASACPNVDGGTATFTSVTLA